MQKKKKKKLLVESQVDEMATNKVICTSERTHKAQVRRTEGGDKLQNEACNRSM